MFEIKYVAPCIVLCNYLDGAVHDYEVGEVDNVNFILECIEGLKLLGDFSAFEYEERVKKVMEERNENH